MFVIMMHGFVERDVDLESRLKAWKAPAMARLEGTWLGLRSTEPLMQTSAERGFPDGTGARAKVNAYLGLKLEDLADAYLYMAAFPARQRRRIAGLVFHARPIAEVLPGRDSNTAMITDESLPAVGSVTPRFVYLGCAAGFQETRDVGKRVLRRPHYGRLAMRVLR